MNRSLILRAWAAMAAVTVLIGMTSVAWTSLAAAGATPAFAASVPAEGAPAEGAFDPMAEFELHAWGPELKVGPIDMSINKAVVYMWLAAFLCCLFAVLQARRMKVRPDNRQTLVETLYEFCYDFLSKRTLGEKTFSKYMPYLASLFLFIWFMNLISFIPLPLNDHHTLFTIGGFPIYSLGIYAATSNINVTLALALLTVGIAHYEGIRHNGVRAYFASWAAPGNFAVKAFTWPLHALSEVLRVVSLSVRLFANMLGGHVLILMMLSLAGIIGSTWVALGGVPVALGFYLFEVMLIVTLQAFIFAILSGIYIGGAAEPSH